MVINKKKILIILISLVIIILIIKVADNMSPPPKIEDYLKDIGFTNEGESALYYKQISEIDEEQYQRAVSNKMNATYEFIYFNINNNQLTKNKMTYEDEITETFIPTYDYTNQKLTYTYRFVYNNANVIFEGEYNLKTTKFTCENTYSYKFDLEIGKEAICEKVKYDIEDFKKEAETLITNQKLLKSFRNST